MAIEELHQQEIFQESSKIFCVGGVSKKFLNVRTSPHWHEI
jgi:hypothetical protein